MQRSRHAGFAVIDVETTGLSPRSDRVADIAVIQLDRDLTPAGEFTTLVRPGQDIAAARVHGITARDAAGAPKFGEIAPALLDLLHGRVIVAHNAPFVVRLLTAEFARTGVHLPELPALCTMRLASQYLPGSPARTLAACCASAGITLGGPHAAVSDARAVAGLLTCYARVSGKIPAEWILALGSASRLAWPALPPTGARLAIRECPARRRSEENPFLARLVRQLPRTGAGAAMESYLAALDAALEDRRVTAAAAGSLRELAGALGADADAVTVAHKAYLGALAAAAQAGGAVTGAGYADLAVVARLLGFPASAVDSGLAAARTVRGGSSFL